jgi:Tfp pilus assembly protein PilV
MAAKGYDDSPPRNGVILFYTILAVVSLFGVAQLLKSYFANIMNSEFQTKVFTVGLAETEEFKAREQEQLEKSGIGSAIKQYAARGHAASPVLRSESGASKPGIAGWSQLKREVPTAPAAPEAVPVQGSTLPEAVQGAEKAPAKSGNASGSQAGGRITPEGTPQPVHDDPKNSRSPANNSAAGKNTAAQKTDANSKAPAATPTPTTP